MPRLAALVPVLVAASAATATADFATADGFSGRVADCTSCHTPPLRDDDARVVVDGVPDAWEPATDYPLAVRAEGGPDRNPAPLQPQGGFEAEALRGTFSPGPGMDGLLRSAHDKQITYTPEGTLQRAWNITWTAPGLKAPPGPVTLWIAAMAANGNHIVATNTSDLGEFGDAVDAVVARIPASAAARATWEALPLQPPSISSIEETPRGVHLKGTTGDANATHLHWHVADAAGNRSVAAAWELVVDAPPGHVLSLWTEGAGRQSPATTLPLDADPPASDKASPAWPFLLPLLLALRRQT